MAPTRSRARGREHARPSSGGAAAEHATKIYTIAIAGIIVITAFLALTSVGHVIDAATQHFMLFYAGVFALIGLCASVGLGLVATDRMFLNPGHRVFIQSAHRAASFGAVTFLIIHIITEILAQRVHLLDAVIPFLSPFRTFYIGLGTIASDLVILLVITGIMRGRFNASGKAWRWRAIHYTSYASFVFGVWHGLLAGRPGKGYVDWSYGFLVRGPARPRGAGVQRLAQAQGEPERAAGEGVGRLGVRPDARHGHVRPARRVARQQLWRDCRQRRSAGAVRARAYRPARRYPRAEPGPAVLRARLRGAAALPGRATGNRNGAHAPGEHRAGAAFPSPAHAAGGPGPMPRVPTGPFPVANTGQLPPYASGPMPRVPTGPFPGEYWSAPAVRERSDAAGAHRPVSGGESWSAAAVRERPDAAGSDRPVSGASPGQLPPYASGPMPRVPTGPFPASPVSSPRMPAARCRGCP